ncbi:MAG: DUF721 domain-containing protein [Gammaproteobacteria bacterium]|nr:DUF721 domain-containing protein [Gammaproteobacteria bacterium]MDH5734842.1 DUF721 domain-containing protein [Gammaproteobacteria bacterium]
MKSISNLINPQLLGKASQLNKLTRLVRSSLPSECRNHVSVADIRDQQLILITDSPVWSSRLRLYQNSILEMLKNHANIQLNQVHIKQTQPKHIAQAPALNNRYLSSSSAKLLKQTADSIDDPDLHQALSKLAGKIAKEP